MHGVQNFPTALEDANLRKIRRLKDEFGGLVIYADHTDANHHLSHYIDMAAISMGAELVEKHLILDRSKRGVDSQAALEPKEFQRYVEVMRSSWAALGNYDFQPLSDSEKKYRRFQKKSLVAKRKMNAGEVIQRSDVNFLRVQSETEGIAPIDFESRVQGKRLVRDKAQDEQILLADLC
jgi:sialic acid synthase SpsE